MKIQRTAWSVVLSSLCMGCLQPVGGVPNGRGEAGGNWTLRLEPSTELDAAERVLSIHVESAVNGTTEVPADISLVEGVPSAVAVSRFAEGETTETLAERLVPVEVFEETRRVQLRPRGLLALGQTYTVLSRSGLLGKFTVAPKNERAYLPRIWPPVDSAFSAMQVIYCGGQVPTKPAVVELFPPGENARIELGLSDAGESADSCIRLQSESKSSKAFLPPLTVEEIALEPSPFATSQQLPELAPVACEDTESRFGPGCLNFSAGQVIVRGPSGPSLWVLSSPLGRHFHTLESGARFAIPRTSELQGGQLRAIVFDLAGRSTLAEASITWPPPEARVVVNEVMANPKGAEPAEEWVELHNAGDAGADMVGWKLADEGGQCDLPHIVLEPGAYVLLTREDFLGGQSGDEPPAVGSAIVRVAQLAKGGISNSGETLRLLDATGKLISIFPARVANRAGTSLARRDASTLDDDPAGFLSHAAPGASPGGPNQVE